ncbi:Histidine acid phosphatase family protein [Trichomonas vaginalis G3]|uniref:Histidine acid phosphatase family protein n=1 Tax=Trichomonas vaginalis (strain ATCC PRA-98 / G3) TaxID=412133 RepID=A2EX58_TRIV3|nr:histidine acid phosphatase [Trichomonas vaginalis G3]EAY02778.1 Histidine acid phosphatase family protein [Trichomonas vaginalis G3]KAI5500612.1 acid phosphatase protein [Trichomonas vaginalis G3]|eukprot:XP_001315001.1 histidine acid phosphatase [Trichomonas vaginalis G3]
MFGVLLSLLAYTTKLGVTIDFPCVSPVPLGDEKVEAVNPLPNMTLKQMIVLTRHGARSPIDSYSQNETEDWYCDDDNQHAWAPRYQAAGGSIFRRFHQKLDPTTLRFKPSCPPGGLITDGMRQHYQLGSFFRKIYVNQLKFLPEYYDPTQIYVRSSEVDRCVRSAISFMNGLYPAATPDEMVTIETGHATLEMLHPQTSQCKDLKQAWDNWVKTYDYLQHKNEATPYLKPLADAVNIDFYKSEATWMFIGDWMATIACTSHQLPDLVNDTVLTYGMKAVEFYSHGFFKYARGVAGSAIMREILRIVDNRLAGKNNYKFALLSAHDVSIVAALTLLGYDNPHWSPFRSYMVTQIWEDQNEQLYIRFVYNNQPVKINFMENESLVKLTRFRSRVAGYLDHCRELP